MVSLMSWVKGNEGESETDDSGFTSIEPLCPEDDQDCLAQLCVRSQAFDSYVQVLPAAAELLKHLTVELRSDEGDAGWSQLGGFVRQLESLEINAFDHDWKMAGKNSEVQHRSQWAKVFPSELAPFQEMPQLPELKKLSVFATSNTLLHFKNIGGHCPNLTELSLGQLWTNDPEHVIVNRDSFTHGGFESLSHVSLSGPSPWVVQSAHQTPDLLSGNPLSFCASKRNPAENRKTRKY